MSLLASTHPVTPPSLCVRGTCHVIVCHVSPYLLPLLGSLPSGVGHVVLSSDAHPLAHEARCRMALPTTGQPAPANFLLKYIDNLYANRCSTAGASHEALEWSGYVGEST